jgi:hypothetical protein
VIPLYRLRTASEAMVESLRRCSRCGHTRDRHPSGEACGHVAYDDEQRGRPCDCAGYERGPMSTEGLRALGDDEADDPALADDEPVTLAEWDWLDDVMEPCS